jgi:hypothetical protein
MIKHIKTISQLIQTLIVSDDFHALVVESAPGWGKSTAIDLALRKRKISAVPVGSYATPLHIYQTLTANPNSVIILDDCAGLFSDAKSMSILKAATWQSSGQDENGKARIVSWGSSSDKVGKGRVEFKGKLILLTNMVNHGKETDAFLSRCLSYRISHNESDIREMLKLAAKNKTYFPNTKLALKVSTVLLRERPNVDINKINLRTLKMGYDLAITHPDEWPELLAHVLPRTEKITDKVKAILHSNLSVTEQIEKFQRETGKSRRTFYNAKKKAGLCRVYHGEKD